MGLVNLRNGNLLIFSLSQELLDSTAKICKQAQFKGVYTASTVPQVIQDLKTKKIDILVSEANLGATSFEDFVKAVRAAFPKVKIVPLLDSTKDVSLKDNLKTMGFSVFLNLPVDSKELIPKLEGLMMEKMGISSAGVVTKDEF